MHRRMKELEDKEKSSDRWTFILAVIALATIFQDMSHPELMPGDTDWLLLVPTLLAAFFTSVRAEYFREKIKERAELFGGRHYGDLE